MVYPSRTPGSNNRTHDGGNTMKNAIFWAKAEEFAHDRIYDTKICRLEPQAYIDFLRQDIKELLALIEYQKKIQSMEAFI